jgi:hypothetical protein
LLDVRDPLHEVPTPTSRRPLLHLKTARTYW